MNPQFGLTNVDIRGYYLLIADSGFFFINGLVPYTLAIIVSNHFRVAIVLLSCQCNVHFRFLTSRLSVSNWGVSLVNMLTTSSFQWGKDNYPIRRVDSKIFGYIMQYYNYHKLSDLTGLYTHIHTDAHARTLLTTRGPLLLLILLLIGSIKEYSPN